MSKFNYATKKPATLFYSMFTGFSVCFLWYRGWGSNPGPLDPQSSQNMDFSQQILQFQIYLARYLALVNEFIRKKKKVPKSLDLKSVFMV